MGKNILKTILVICCALLLAEVIFLGVDFYRGQPNQSEITTPTTVPEQDATETTGAVAGAPTTVPETTETEPAETEPEDVRFRLTFAGDCTLASTPSQFSNPNSFVGTVGEDYGHPFRNVLEYFENDDFTMINLEGVLADKGYAANKTFTFRGPTAYTQILTGSSVEAVTLANNHTLDFGKDGYKSTTQALTGAGIWFVEEDKTTLVTTESGLIIGLYADSFYFNVNDIQKNVKSLRDQGAEIVICAFHWGVEGSYRPTADQKEYARAAIDAGADIVYGHHPHVLQPIEEYNGGYIFYSLGNFSFGGNHFPRDMDSALIQLDVIRDEDGSISLGELTIIPVSISSKPVQNNFQPTPYEEGSAEYERTLSKLDGTFNGPDLVVNYDHLNPTEPPTEAPTEPSAPEGTNPPGEEPPVDTPTEPPADTPAEPPADTPAEPPADTPAEPPADTPAEPPADTPAEPPADTPAEPPADTPDPT